MSKKTKAKAAQFPLAEKLCENPLLVREESLTMFQTCLAHLEADKDTREVMSEITSPNLSDDDFWGAEPGSWRAGLRPYNVHNGILQIPVMGILVNRMSYQLGRWATGYTYIEKAVKRGMDDSSVKGIAFICDSPGGEAAGNFELVDYIFSFRGQKPMRAYAADMAASAAYSIASCADTISMTRSAFVGSIGVASGHMSFEDNLKMVGIKFTPIFAGKHKMDGHPLLDLSPQAKARYEARVEKLYEEFTSTVARNRGMDQAAVIATEALTYDAEDAIAVGLADQTGILEDEIALFEQDLTTENGDHQMADKSTNEDMVSKADHETALAAATAAGETKGAELATARQNEILNAPEAEKRPKMAVSLLKTSMSSEEAIAFMKDQPEEAALAAPEAVGGDKEENKDKLDDKSGTTDHFSDAMNKDKQPNVSADDTDGGTGDDLEADPVKDILSAHSSVTGL